MTISYADAIRAGHYYLMQKYDKVFCIGQGLWAPWYVGRSMHELELKFGRERVIDSPVSEVATTGAAVGAALCGYRPIVVHPRMDFMILAIDQIVNQAAKWSYMFGGQASPAITIRGIVNRGGEQGAQHSQALHAWFAHVPGLRVVMPATVSDARDLLIASVLSDGPVLYIDDRWLYHLEDDLPEAEDVDLDAQGPRILASGRDLTLVAASYSVHLCMQAKKNLESEGISCEVIDLRIINPLKTDLVLESVKKTGRCLAVDGGWSTCGLAAEILAVVSEGIDPSKLRVSPARITLPNAPAPTSKALEQNYYPSVEGIVAVARTMLN